MKLLHPWALALLLTAAAAPVVNASLVTYDFVVTSAIPNNASFTAFVTIDDAFTGTQSRTPTAFTAQISGSSDPHVLNRTWTLNELFGTPNYTFNSGVLTFSALVAIDTAAPAGVDGYYLNLGSTGVSSPTTFSGNWVLRAASVPDCGPGLVAPATLVALGLLAHRSRRKRLMEIK